jgi:protein gp37
VGKNSEIAWTHHTFNPWWGCTKVSPACDRCYAETWAKRCGLDVWGKDAARRFFGDKHWAEPLTWNRAAAELGVMHRVFCGSMCDFFENRMDLDEHRLRVFRMVPETPNLLWLFLSKRPLQAVQMLPREWQKQWPRNVMIGVTIEDQQRLDLRMPNVVLLHEQFPGVLTFASCEPLLSALDWSEPANRGTGVSRNHYLQYFDWVVAGGESGAHARPCHPDWARKLRDDCVSRDDMCRPWPLPFLWKQRGEFCHWSQTTNDVAAILGSMPDGPIRLGKNRSGRLLDGREWNELPRLPYGPQSPEVGRG